MMPLPRCWSGHLRGRYSVIKVKSLFLLLPLLFTPLESEAGMLRKPVTQDADSSLIIDGKTVLSLSASEQMSVAQDRVSATLSIHNEGKEPAAVQEFINQKMREAIKKAENTSGVKVSTGGYQVYRNYYEPNPSVNGGKERPFRWVGEQSLILDSANSEALLKLTGEIQKMGFATQGLSYYLSREKAESLRDELAARALETLKVRANAIAKQLGMGKTQFAQVNIGGGDSPVFYGKAMRMEAMAMADGAESTPPVAKAGETDVSVSVQALVIVSE